MSVRRLRVSLRLRRFKKRCEGVAEPLEIGGVVVALERDADETLLSAVEDRDFDSMFVVEALLQILRCILGEAKRDHLPEELLGVRRQRLQTQLVACAP